MFWFKTCGADACISCQNIIYIIESTIICNNSISLYRETELIADFYIFCIIIRNRSFKAAFRTLIISKLAVMIKAVLQTLSAFLAKTSFTDLICLIFHDRTADSIINAWVATVHCHICWQRIITVYDQFHIRDGTDHLFQNIHRNVDLTVTVKLITEKIGHHHVIRFHTRKNMPGGCFIYLDTGIIRINMTI